MHDYKEELWKTKGTENTILLGDRNIHYFHQNAVIRQRRINIVGMYDNSSKCIEGRDNIANCRNIYFENLLITSAPTLNYDIINLVPPMISHAENDLLISCPSVCEIHDALFNMQPNASPGLNGFPACFFQKNCPIVSKDIVNTVQAFFKSGHMLTQLNQTFITLIPKVLHPDNPGDYRPISPCNIAYKINFKVIANRLKPFLDRPISPYQSAFVI